MPDESPNNRPQLDPVPITTTTNHNHRERPKPRPPELPGLGCGMSQRAGRLVAKALGIKLQDNDPYQELDRPGASMMSNGSDHSFVEEPPQVLDHLNALVPSGKEIYDYLFSLFPFLSWIGHYNLQWLIGDLVAGEHPCLCLVL